MKVLLFGARKNLGDYLIRERSLELLEARGRLAGNYEERFSFSEIPDSPLKDDKDPCIVICGGPGLTRNTFPGRYPLMKQLLESNIRVVMLGVGWYGIPGDDCQLNNYSFNETTLNLFDHIQKHGGAIGVRDDRSAEVLRRHSGAEPIVTGCPSWFPDLSHGADPVADAEAASGTGSGKPSVVVSTPSNPMFVESCQEMVMALCARRDEVDVKVAFHTGWDHDEYLTSAKSVHMKRLRRFCEDAGATCHDVSGSYKHYSIYDRADWHVGFRVHAHLYALSFGKPSILFHEDGRGLAACDATTSKGQVMWRRPALSRALCRFEKMKAARYVMHRYAPLELFPMSGDSLSSLVDSVFSEEIAQLSKASHRSMIERRETMDRFIDTYIPR